MRIVNKETNETVANITTNQSMSLDEVIALVGEIFPANENENVLINGKWYYYEDLCMEWNTEEKNMENKLAGSFLDDDEKMHDFFRISKEEFLFSYSYLTEDDYKLTVLDILKYITGITDEEG